VKFLELNAELQLFKNGLVIQFFDFLVGVYTTTGKYSFNLHVIELTSTGQRLDFLSAQTARYFGCLKGLGNHRPTTI
jgi:hypothetical protein